MVSHKEGEDGFNVPKTEIEVDCVNREDYCSQFYFYDNCLEKLEDAC